MKFEQTSFELDFGRATKRNQTGAAPHRADDSEAGGHFVAVGAVLAIGDAGCYAARAADGVVQGAGVAVAGCAEVAVAVDTAAAVNDGGGADSHVVVESAAAAAGSAAAAVAVDACVVVAATDAVG